MTACACGSESFHPATAHQKAVQLGGSAEGRSHPKRPEGQSLATSRRGALLLERSTRGSLVGAHGLASRPASRVYLRGRDRGLASGPRHEPARSNRDRRARRLGCALPRWAQRSLLCNFTERYLNYPRAACNDPTPHPHRSLPSLACSRGSRRHRHGGRRKPYRPCRSGALRGGVERSRRSTPTSIARRTLGAGRVTHGDTASMAAHPVRPPTPGGPDQPPRQQPAVCRQGRPLLPGGATRSGI